MPSETKSDGVSRVEIDEMGSGEAEVAVVASSRLLFWGPGVVFAEIPPIPAVELKWEWSWMRRCGSAAPAEE